MALKMATRTGGDYLNLTNLAKDGGPFLAVFRIVEFHPAAPGDYGYPIVPVIADVLICSGPAKGEVHLAERIFGAPTSTLRGVKNPTKDHPEALPPVNEVGDEIVVRVEYVERKGSQPFAGLNVPSDVEFEAVAKVHADGKGWEGKEGRPF